MAIDQDEIHRLSVSKNVGDREKAANILMNEFYLFPDKSVVWNDLHNLTNDNEFLIRSLVGYAMGSVFTHIPEEHKSAVWHDLHRLSNDEYSHVRIASAVALCYAFQFIPEEHKSAAWDDLHRLSNDQDIVVRIASANALGHVFQLIPGEHKSTAWDDLHRLSNDREWGVRCITVFSLGSIFPYISEEHKSVTWDDLYKLTSNEDLVVRSYANYSLGKISIYKASKSIDEIKARNHLEEAIQCFKKSFDEKLVRSSSKFCYLFYCSFDAILFKKVNSKKEIEDYISEAKKEIWDSESKRKLIEAIEQLAKALEIAHDVHEKGINWQEELKRCSEICDHVEQLMKENKEKTPAIHDLYKIAKPSFDKTIKGLIEAADVACKEAKGTPAEAVVYPVKKEIQRWCVEDQIKIETKIDRLYSLLKIKVPDIPENRLIIDQIDDIKKTRIVEDKIDIITLLIMSLPSTSFPKMIDDLKEEMNNRFDKVDESQHRIELSLEQVHQKLDKSLDKLHTLSLDFKTHGKELESEYIDTFEHEIRTLIAERDSETLDLFAQNLDHNRSLLLNEINKSGASDNEKKEGEKSIFELKDLPRKIKDIMKSATTEVSKELVVSLIATIILESVFPILGPAAKEVVKILVSIINSRTDRRIVLKWLI